MQELSDFQRLRIRQWAGTGLLWIGGLLAVLIFVDRSGLGSVRLPAFWYRSRSLFVLTCAGLFAGGAMLLRSPRSQTLRRSSAGLPPGWMTNETGFPLFETARFYTREDCGLCDAAMDVLEDYGRWLPEIEFINVDDDPRLVALHGECVPVLEFDGRVRFRGSIQRWLLERHLTARWRQQQIGGSHA